MCGIVLQGPWQAAIEAAVAAIEATDTDCRVLDIGTNAGVHPLSLRWLAAAVVSCCIGATEHCIDPVLSGSIQAGHGTVLEASDTVSSWGCIAPCGRR